MGDYNELVGNQALSERTDRDLPNVYGSDLHDPNLNFDAAVKMGKPESVMAAAERVPSPHDVSEQFHSALSLNSYAPTPPRSVMPDPLLRQAYAMPPAGLPARQSHENYYSSPSAGRQYKMASDIFGTGMDRSWSSESGNSPHSPNSRGQQPMEPTSFKITESATRTSASSLTESESMSNIPSNNRKARESAGNPLTGQGYDNASTKTAKRYFEGSNANQKLW